MKPLLMKSLAIASLLVLTAPALSAGYLKMGDVKGESAAPQPATERKIDKPDENPKTLLLPAVQQAQSAKPRPAKGKVEPKWKVEEGSNQD